jgi:Ca-activated chloride channel family protein
MSVLERHSESAVGELRSGDYRFPLLAVDVAGQVQGLLYSATVTQTFLNSRDTRMEAVYIFPLPPRAAVHGFRLRIGDRLVVGNIQERGQARAAYRRAVKAGHRAALLEEERSDIFTTTVGNIAPGETVEVSFDLSGPMSCFCNTARLRFPLVVGEVYIPGPSLPGGSVGDGTSLDTELVPDASRLTPPRLAPGAKNPVRLSLRFSVDPAGLQVSQVESTCHFARTKHYQDGTYEIGLLPGIERLDRAFVMQITYPENTLQTSLLLDPKKRAFALTVVPPTHAKRDTRPRDVVILLDRSGSMEGWLVVAARRATARIIDSLTREDRFAVITFAQRTAHFDPRRKLQPADSFCKMRAAEFLDKVGADGGTEILPALREAWTYFDGDDRRDQHVILITDGEVADDERLAEACRNGVRLSTVGIGEAAREGLLTRLSENSGGLCTLIPSQAELDKDLAEMHRRWGQPVWKNLSLNGSDEIYRSPQFWDVWQDIPMTFFGRLPKNWGTKPLEVEGWLEGRGPLTLELAPTLVTTPLVHRAWARSRLLDLEDLCAVGDARPHELVQLSVSAQVLCRYTAFVAIDTEVKVNRETELETAVQPVEGVIKAKTAASAPSHSLEFLFDEAPGEDLFGGDCFAEQPCSDPFDDGCFAADLFSDGSGDLFEEAPACFASQDCGPLNFDDFDSSVPPSPSDFTLFDDVQPVSAPRSAADMTLADAAAPTAAGDAHAVVYSHRLERSLAGDGFETLKSGPGSSFTERLADCLEVVKRLEREFSEVLRDGVFSQPGGQLMRQVLSALIDYREALEAILQRPDPLDLGPAQTARRALTDLLASCQGFG